jgi:hypothetical protein
MKNASSQKKMKESVEYSLTRTSFLTRSIKVVQLELFSGQDLLKARTDNDSWNIRNFYESYLRSLLGDLLERENKLRELIWKNEVKRANLSLSNLAFLGRVFVDPRSIGRRGSTRVVVYHHRLDKRATKIFNGSKSREKL